MRRFNGLHVVVTGGSSGIGAAAARAFGARGAKVSLIARGSDRLEDVAERLRRSGIPVAVSAADVGDRERSRAVIDELVVAQGPCDILLTAAGIVHPGRFWESEYGVFREQMETNYFGTLHAIEAVVPSMMRRRRGTIIGISSGAGLMGVYGYTAYSPTKFAVRGLLECLRSEMKPYGVGVHCVFSGDVDTPGLQLENQAKPAETAAITGTIKVLSPQRVAEAIVEGAGKDRFAIIPDLQTRVLARSMSLIDGVLYRTIDRKVRKAQSSRAVH
jgi:3-dehydrosphinganine reductase